MVVLMILIILFCFVGCRWNVVEVVAVVVVMVLLEVVVLGAVLRKPLPRAHNPMWIWLQF
jgi:hypothetical protein